MHDLLDGCAVVRDAEPTPDGLPVAMLILFAGLDPDDHDRILRRAIRLRQLLDRYGDA